MAATEPGEPEASSTRESILEAALELFTEQGFDKTSLREVAEQVGVTKAALYYHFRSKEEILESLVERIHRFAHHGLDLFPDGDGPIDRQQLLASCRAMVDLVLSQYRIFQLMERNRTAVEALHNDDPAHQAEHQAMEARWKSFVANTRVPLRERLRISAAMGALMASAFGATQLAGDVDREEVREEILAMLSDLLGAPSVGASRGRPRAGGEEAEAASG